MPEPLIDIENLTIAFGETEALHGISFSVHKSEIAAIVGESGSGKSITSLAIMHLLQGENIKISGAIHFHNAGQTTELLTASDRQMTDIRGSRIAMIFQEPMTSLNPVQTCGNQVAEALMQHKQLSRAEAHRQVTELFRQVDLPDPQAIYHRYPHEISGGQKQRVMIAMAMSCSPELLICDEPTTALDVTVQKSILELIRQLQRKTGMGVIFISHDLNVVAGIADKIIVMNKGRIMETGSAEEIFLHPQNSYTKALLACRPALYRRDQRLPVVSDFLDHPEKDFVFTPATVKPEFQEKEKANTHLLEVQNLHVWYPQKQSFFGKPLSWNKAVDGLNLQIKEGETLGLVGGSGCGKTTLGRTLLHLIRPHEGHIFFHGRDITQLSEKQMRPLRYRMQLIFQDPYSSLNPRMTVGEAIAEPLRVNGFCPPKLIKDVVINWLERVSLRPEHYDRYPHQFSGGQRQRIVIARALAMKPEFVVCDESVSALDVSVQAQVLNLLNDLKAELGFTALFISHDLSVVHYICDRIMVMHKGKIVESGPSDQVYFHPRHSYTQQLLEALPKGLERAS